jgi:hypothetical protein
MNYKATMKVMGKEYTAYGKTKEEVLANLKVAPNFARGAAILKLDDGEKSEERVLTPFLAQKMFSLSPKIREVHLKQVGMRFSL